MLLASIYKEAVLLAWTKLHQQFLEGMFRYCLGHFRFEFTTVCFVILHAVMRVFVAVVHLFVLDL